MSRISIGLPVFNGEKYLKEAIDSILNQTFKDFELIISDNASTDSTDDICRQYAAIDSRIKYFRNKNNRGAAWNYNRVFHLAKSDLFKWMASDDIMAPTCLQRCIDIFENTQDTILCYPLTVDIDANGKRIGRCMDDLHLQSPDPSDRLTKFLFRNITRCNTVFGLIKRDVLAKTSLIESYNGSDNALLAHLSLLGKFYEVPEELFYRRHHSGMSLKKNKNPKEVAAWFNPKNKRKVIILPISRLFLGYILCVLKVDIKLIKKFTCLREIVRKIWWTKKYIKDELVTTAKNLI